MLKTSKAKTGLQKVYFYIEQILQLASTEPNPVVIFEKRWLTAYSAASSKEEKTNNYKLGVAWQAAKEIAETKTDRLAESGEKSALLLASVSSSPSVPISIRGDSKNTKAAIDSADKYRPIFANLHLHDFKADLEHDDATQFLSAFFSIYEPLLPPTLSAKLVIVQDWWLLPGDFQRINEKISENLKKLNTRNVEDFREACNYLVVGFSTFHYKQRLEILDCLDKLYFNVIEIRELINQAWERLAFQLHDLKMTRQLSAIMQRLAVCTVGKEDLNDKVQEQAGKALAKIAVLFSPEGRKEITRLSTRFKYLQPAAVVETKSDGPDQSEPAQPQALVSREPQPEKLQQLVQDIHDRLSCPAVLKKDMQDALHSFNEKIRRRELDFYDRVALFASFLFHPRFANLKHTTNFFFCLYRLCQSFASDIFDLLEDDLDGSQCSEILKLLAIPGIENRLRQGNILSVAAARRSTNMFDLVENSIVSKLAPDGVNVKTVQSQLLQFTTECACFFNQTQVVEFLLQQKGFKIDFKKLFLFVHDTEIINLLLASLETRLIDKPDSKKSDAEDDDLIIPEHVFDTTIRPRFNQELSEITMRVVEHFAPGVQQPDPFNLTELIAQLSYGGYVLAKKIVFTRLQDAHLQQMAKCIVSRAKLLAKTEPSSAQTYIRRWLALPNLSDPMTHTLSPAQLFLQTYLIKKSRLKKDCGTQLCNLHEKLAKQSKASKGDEKSSGSSALHAEQKEAQFSSESMPIEKLELYSNLAKGNEWQALLKMSEISHPEVLIKIIVPIVYTGNIWALNFLLDRVKPRYGVMKQMLVMAIQLGHINCTNSLFEYCSKHFPSSFQRDTLIALIENYEYWTSLLKHGLKIENGVFSYKPQFAFLPTHAADPQRFCRALDFILKKFEQKVENLNLALHCLAKYMPKSDERTLQVIEQWITSGADVNFRYKNHSALYCFTVNGQLGCCKLMLRYKAQILVPSIEGTIDGGTINSLQLEVVNLLVGVARQRKHSLQAILGGSPPTYKSTFIPPTIPLTPEDYFKKIAVLISQLLDSAPRISTLPLIVGELIELLAASDHYFYALHDEEFSKLSWKKISGALEKYFESARTRAPNAVLQQIENILGFKEDEYTSPLRFQLELRVPKFIARLENLCASIKQAQALAKIAKAPSEAPEQAEKKDAAKDAAQGDTKLTTEPETAVQPAFTPPHSAAFWVEASSDSGKDKIPAKPKAPNLQQENFDFGPGL